MQQSKSDNSKYETVYLKIFNTLDFSKCITSRHQVLNIRGKRQNNETTKRQQWIHLSCNLKPLGVFSSGKEGIHVCMNWEYRLYCDRKDEDKII